MATTLEKPALMETSVHPPARLLFGPGPSQVHPRVYQALAQPIVGHLDAYFFKISGDIQNGLRKVFGTKNELTFVISATGSGGMETAISNFVQQGTKVVSFANGFFCDRMSEMARRQGAELVRFEKPWGEVFGDEEAAAFIRQEKPEGRDVCSGRDLGRGFPARRSHLQGGPRSGRAGHRRLCHLAGRHASGS